MKTLIKKIIPPFFIEFYHFLQAILANIIYGFPSHKLVVIGVTGTDGKTTTGNFIVQLLEGLNVSCGLLSTTRFKIGDTFILNESKMTTLSAFQTQKRLKEMVKAKNTHVVLETSSHALSQYRVWGIAYDVAVLTNISREHLDYHKTMQAYTKAKQKLFLHLGRQKRKKKVMKSFVLNKDDDSYASFSKLPCDQLISYAMNEGKVHVKDVVYDISKTKAKIAVNDKYLTIEIPMPGKVNVYNVMAAIAVVTALGYSPHTIEKASSYLESVEGRMQSIKINEKQNFSVFIDYAVTPKAFESLYETVSLMKHHNIIAVFGACGDRDKGKRPILGEIAYKHADYIILTNEDNWSENPRTIIEEIKKGILSSGGKENINFEVIIDRSLAIQKAVEKASKGDIILVTGKGSETGMAIGKDTVTAFSDKEEILKALKKRFA